MKQLIIKSIGNFINITAIIAPRWSANYSFNLLCKVKRAGISERGRKFFEAGQQTFLEVSGESTVLHQWGNGPKKILFLHGWMSNSQRWLPYFELLDKEQYTIYALDAPGHGMAKGKILNIEMYRQAIVEALTITENLEAVVCHSLSNTTMTYLHLMQPNLPIKRYVTLGAPSGMDAIFVYFQEMLGLSKKAMNNLSNKINSILKIPHQEIHISNFFKNVEQPILVIHDKDDSITPLTPVNNALRECPNIEVFITEGLQHDLKSDDVYNRVIKFIEEENDIESNSNFATVNSVRT